MESPIWKMIIDEGWKGTLVQLRKLVEGKFDSASQAEKKKMVQLVVEAEQELAICMAE